MKWLTGFVLLFACIGCGKAESTTEGLEQDAISKYIAENPNIDEERSMGKEE